MPCVTCILAAAHVTYETGTTREYIADSKLDPCEHEEYGLKPALGGDEVPPAGA